MPHPALGADLVSQQICRQSDDWNNGTSSKMFRYHPTKLNNSKSVFPSCTPSFNQRTSLSEVSDHYISFLIVTVSRAHPGPSRPQGNKLAETLACMDHWQLSFNTHWFWLFCVEILQKHKIFSADSLDWCMTLLYPWSWKDGNVSKLHSRPLVKSHFPRGNGTHAHAHRIRQSLSLTHTHTMKVRDFF